VRRRDAETAVSIEETDMSFYCEWCGNCTKRVKAQEVAWGVVMSHAADNKGEGESYQ